MNNQVCIHCFVTGKVQGVWFRASTKKEADKLGLTGWVRNLPDGRVEVFACGERDQVYKLHTWLKHGPQRAEVIDLSLQEKPWEIHEDFQVI